MVLYEWDYETTDDDGDIIDHNHADKLSDFSESDKTETLVLIRDEGNADAGLTGRLWAYVIDGKLPEFFTTADGAKTGYKVPIKYRKELFRHLGTT